MTSLVRVSDDVENYDPVLVGQVYESVVNRAESITAHITKHRSTLTAVCNQIITFYKKRKIEPSLDNIEYTEFVESVLRVELEKLI